MVNCQEARVNLKNTQLNKLKSAAEIKTETILRVFFFYLAFLSRTFTNHRTAGEGRGHFLNSSLPLPPASQTLGH